MRSKLSLSPAMIALLLGVALLVWLVLGDMQGFRDQPPEADEPHGGALPSVEVRLSRAQRYTPHLVLQGQLEPRRSVVLRAHHAGSVVALPQPLGARVEAGDLLLEIDAKDLPAQLARAEAELALRQAELNGAQRLRERNLVSDNEILRLESELAATRAELASLRETLADTRLKAPFDGMLDQLDVELGEFVQVGDEIGMLVETDRLTASAWAPQRRAPALTEGLPVTVTLLDGRELQGEVSFVSSSANTDTRSYALEVDIANPEHLRIAGASATLEIALPASQAHRLSPARLVLNDQGQLGVKHVDDDNRVRFSPVTLLSADATHAWVSGLPDRVRLITLGGGFVKLNQQVAAVNIDDREAG
ncbi:membrane fusion protein, multidrug efflux system [Modicisalibacter muralis]|uniref:Membrane fusion protein, multidrug efflux system n=1 Tax=Modicisalibacter muralis TaxID=119000 RepID=A0A1G9RK75_9GAMM|nr:efflux RND transporter periplasmic adaptor subunit [Halomonas muralis]SDM23666.1 membrane fusion protein, multidrug efflux system [Halomonas muralis]